MNDLHPQFTKNVFKLRSSHCSFQNAYHVRNIKLSQMTFGSNILLSVGPLIWNGLSDKLEYAKKMRILELLIKQWDDRE